MVILRATSILGGQKEDKGMMYNITPVAMGVRDGDGRENGRK
jgi:hypothetical protein